MENNLNYISYPHFIKLLINNYEIFKNKYDEDLDFWSPEQPPLTLLFSSLGNEFISGFEKINPDHYDEIFLDIEKYILMDDENDVSNAVATGFLEGIVNLSGPNKKNWDAIESKLLNASKKYAHSWLNF